MKALSMLVLLVLVGGCQPGAGPAGPPDLSPPHTATVRLTVTAVMPVAAVSTLAVTVEIMGGKSTLMLASPGMLPPSRTFDIGVLYSGTATITVEAQDASGKTVGKGTGMVQTTIDQSVDLTVTLQPV